MEPWPNYHTSQAIKFTKINITNRENAMQQVVNRSKKQSNSEKLSIKNSEHGISVQKT